VWIGIVRDHIIGPY